MQKDLKGGYQLISLGMTPIEDITYIDVELLKTTKRIVLTGISIDGKSQLPDKTVDIEQRGSGTIGIKNVYGFDLIVDEDGSVEVTETITGTQLYLHTITADATSPGDVVKLKVISTDGDGYANFNELSESDLIFVSYENEQYSGYQGIGILRGTGIACVEIDALVVDSAIKTGTNFTDVVATL